MEPLGRLLARCAAEAPDRPCLRYEGRSRSFAELDGAVTAAARRLATLGIVPGDRVGLFLPNGLDFPTYWLALARLGAIAVPANTRYQRDDLAYLYTDAGVTAVVTTAALAPIAIQAKTAARARWMICLTSATDLGGDEIDLSGVAEAPAALPDVGLDDLLNLQYTSGTTGFPKGCMLTHRYWYALGLRAAELTGLRPDDVVITAQPFYYLDPQWTLVMSLIGRVPLVVLPRFSASTFWESATVAGATVFYCIGTMPNLLAAQPTGPFDRAHRLRLITCSGIDPARHAEFERRWGVPWREAFGMTETGADIAVPVEDASSVGSGTIGVPAPDRRAAILSSEGVELPPGQVGELCLTGGVMMKGYWNNPDATAQAFRGGWFHTGDLARKDEQGRYYLVGRVKDVIRRGGENIAAVEVEQALAGHPAVLQVAVTGRADPIRGEEVEAFILPKPGARLDPPAMAAYLEGRIAAFKRPRFITEVREMPLTPSERIEKHRLRAPRNPFVVRSYDLADGRWQS